MKQHLIACYIGLICLEEIQLIACCITRLEEIHLVAQQKEAIIHITNSMTHKLHSSNLVHCIRLVDE